MGRYKDALPLAQQGAAAAIREMPDDDVSIADTRYILARAMAHLRHADEAEHLIGLIKDISNSAYGNNDAGWQGKLHLLKAEIANARGRLSITRTEATAAVYLLGQTDGENNANRLDALALLRSVPGEAKSRPARPLQAASR
jgi:hypothetical protein